MGRRDPARDALGRENAPAPEALLRNPVTRSLLAGPATARPWRKDPDELIEEMELYASCPGFDATLPHTFHAQPRGLTTLDMPVLLLWGKLDVILLPRQGRRFERLIPGPSCATSAAPGTCRCRTCPTCSPRRSPSSP